MQEVRANHEFESVLQNKNAIVPAMTSGYLGYTSFTRLHTYQYFADLFFSLGKYMS